MQPAPAIFVDKQSKRNETMAMKQWYWGLLLAVLAGSVAAAELNVKAVMSPKGSISPTAAGISCSWCGAKGWRREPGFWPEPA